MVMENTEVQQPAQVRTASKLRVKILLGILVLAIAGLALVLPTDPELMSKLAAPFASKTASPSSTPDTTMMKYDRPIGWRLSNAAAKEFFGRIPTHLNKEFVVIFSSGCEGCTLNQVTKEQLQVIREAMIFVMLPPDASLQESADALQPPAMAVGLDRGDARSKEFNAYFQPRAYLFGRDLRLKSIQEPGEKLEDFFTRCGLAKKGSQ